jgi:hypothetical protein
MWTGTFTLPAGEYEYKIAYNNDWAENYGMNAEAGGANIPLSVSEETEITFTYNQETHEITDSINNG